MSCLLACARPLLVATCGEWPVISEEPEGCEPPTSFTDYYISAKRIEQEVLPVGQAPLSPPGTTCPASFKPTTVFA